MNNQLLSLYENHWDSVVNDVLLPSVEANHQPAFPYLICPSQKYVEAKKKIMICGQETQGWGRNDFPIIRDVTPIDLQHLYDGFVNREDHNGQLVRPGRPSSYWNFIGEIMSGCPNAGFVFQNVVKVGKILKPGCDNFVYDLLKQKFLVWHEEIKILKPDCIIFLTGYSYDSKIREIVGDFDAEKVAETNGKLDKLIFRNGDIPIAYRTYHPRYLSFSKLYHPMVKVFKDIINDL